MPSVGYGNNICRTYRSSSGRVIAFWKALTDYLLGLVNLFAVCGKEVINQNVVHKHEETQETHGKAEFLIEMPGTSETQQSFNQTRVMIRRITVLTQRKQNLMLKKLRKVAIGVVTIASAGTYAFLQVSTHNSKDHFLKVIHWVGNLSFAASSLLATLVALTIYVISPKSAIAIQLLKYSLRVAIFLAMDGYLLAVVFIIRRG